MGNNSSTVCKMMRKFENGKIDTETYNENRCAICLTPLVKPNDCKLNCNVCVSTALWTCHHQFHNSCISQWTVNNSTCPICRSENMISNDDDEIYSDVDDNNDLENDNNTIENDLTYRVEYDGKNYIMKVDNIFNNLPITLTKYTELWNYELCDNQYDNHSVTFFKSYGVLGTCSCGSTQAFNYLG
jgi:hypothetical protein